MQDEQHPPAKESQEQQPQEEEQPQKPIFSIHITMHVRDRLQDMDITAFETAVGRDEKDYLTLRAVIPTPKEYDYFKSKLEFIQAFFIADDSLQQLTLSGLTFVMIQTHRFFQKR